MISYQRLREAIFSARFMAAEIEALARQGSPAEAKATILKGMLDGMLIIMGDET